MSSLWAHGCWSAFLALFVAQMSNMVQQQVKPKLARFNLNCQGLPSWVYYLTWVLELFQVIVIFGPTEAFHVPFFGQSKTTAYSELLKGTDLKEATCDKYYGNYFKVLSIEKQAKEADPDLQYGGFCSLEFLGFVQAMFIFQGMLWIVLLVAAAPRLLRKGAEGGRWFRRHHQHLFAQAFRPWDQLRVFALYSIWALELPNHAVKFVDPCTSDTVLRPDRP